MMICDELILYCYRLYNTVNSPLNNILFKSDIVLLYKYIFDISSKWHSGVT